MLVFEMVRMMLVMEMIMMMVLAMEIMMMKMMLLVMEMMAMTMVLLESMTMMMVLEMMRTMMMMELEMIIFCLACRDVPREVLRVPVGRRLQPHRPPSGHQAGRRPLAVPGDLHQLRQPGRPRQPR